VTVHVHRRVADEPNSYEDLIQFWQRLEEPLTQDELHEFWHPRTPGFIVAARCFCAIFVLSTLVCLPTALRIVGHALE
jgi:hypothetical protein